MVRIRSSLRDIDNQPRRDFALRPRPSLLVNKFQKGLNLGAKRKETILVSQDGCIRGCQIADDAGVNLLRVIPDNDALVLDLFGDQVYEIFSYLARFKSAYLLT